MKDKGFGKRHGRRLDGRRVAEDDVRMDEATHGKDASELVDPALVARLEAWFGDGVPESGEDELEFIPGFGYVEPESEQDRWRRERATEAAAEGTLWRDIHRRGDAAAEMVEPLPPIALAVESPIHRFEFARWGIRAAPEMVEVGSEEAREALAENVPQAVLRDLHRPVMEVGEVELEQRVLDTATGEDQTDLIHALIRARYRVEIEQLRPAGVVASEILAELRARLDEPWEDARPENPTPWGGDVDLVELMRWFAPGGGG